MRPQVALIACIRLIALLCLNSRDLSADALTQELLRGDYEALPLLAAQHPESLTPELMHTLAAHPDWRLRELVAHHCWNPHVSLDTQRGAVMSLEPAEVRERAALWFRGRVSSRDPLTLADIQSYWTSLAP